ALIERLALKNILNTPLHACSGGELQRLLLARAVMQNPELLILDEPTQGVDIHGQAELYEIIEDIRQEIGCAILMISHDLHVVMAKTNLILCLNHHICCHGHPQEVGNHPAYIELFGKAHAQTLAVYNHSHDHHHQLDGVTHSGSCSHD
ncbi:UNVERIFIED_CONTAM: hypothetical protein GTU68_032450, partial [Idotea baltica]|nr:hypothetical protein [Idotea baltica]